MKIDIKMERWVLELALDAFHEILRFWYCPFQYIGEELEAH